MIDAFYRMLASLGFDEPIHSPITHMPIGLVVGALVFFLVAIIFKRKSLVLTARHASILALVFAFPTILFGVFDWIHFYHAVFMPAIRIKMILASVVLVLLGLGIILGSEIKLHKLWMTVIYSLSFVAVMGLGYMGAGILYGRGTAAESAVQATPVPGQKEAAQPAGGVDEGRSLFVANCQACHGNGENAIDATYPLKGSKKLASPELLTAFLRAPTMRDGSAGQMPPFSEDDLADGQARSLWAYVSTAWK